LEDDYKSKPKEPRSHPDTSGRLQNWFGYFLICFIFTAGPSLKAFFPRSCKMAEKCEEQDKTGLAHWFLFEQEK
jgi:hypothetical protein